MTSYRKLHLHLNYEASSDGSEKKINIENSLCLVPIYKEESFNISNRRKNSTFLFDVQHPNRHYNLFIRNNIASL